MNTKRAPNGNSTYEGRYINNLFILIDIIAKNMVPTNSKIAI